MSFEFVRLEQNTPEWRRWRSSGIGASDAPCLMGEDPWKSASALKREKLYPLSERMSNAAMRRGLALEPAARAAYSAFKAVAVQPACVQSSRYPWMRASLDGLNARERRVVEIKCGASCYKRTASDRTVPRRHYGQLQHILAVLDYSSIDFWCYAPGRRPIHIEIGRNDVYIRRLVAREKQFLDLIAPAVPAGG